MRCSLDRPRRRRPRRADSASLLLAALVAPAALVRAQDASDVVVPGERPLAEADRAELAAIDPLVVGWESEARASAASAALGRLGRALDDSGPLPESLSAALAEAEATNLVPAEWTEAFDDGWFRVRRGSPGAEAAPDRAPSGTLAARLGVFAARWQPGTLHTKLKVTGIRDVEGGFETSILAHAFGRAAEGGWLEHTADWIATWASAGDDTGEPRLTRLAATRTEEVVVPEPRLRETDAFRRLDGFSGTGGQYPLPYGWGDGLDTLRANHEQRLGLPLLGAPAGVAVGDVDGDGFEDVYLCQPGGLPNRLLLRRAGGFDDRSSGSGADWLDFSRAALLLELDGDGDADLVASVGTELVFASNDGEGHFTIEARVPAPQSTSLAAADYDGDGDLDVYACVYLTPYVSSAAGSGGFPVPYHDADNGPLNHLFENDGAWGFADVAIARGLDATRFSFAAAWEDYDADGDPDLYVANDFGRNNLYRNDGERFVDVAAEAGVEDVSAGMGVSWGDYDGDGRFDLYVANMYSSAGNRIAYQRQFQPDADAETLSELRRHARGNSLFRNKGDGTFEDVSLDAGVTMGRWAWGARFVDLNSDGRLDLVSPNGFLTTGTGDDL